MLDDFEERDPRSAEFYAFARDNFEQYVQDLLDEEHGLNLRDGWVPCTHRWLVTPDETIVGVTRLRHRIDTPFLMNDGGHIGYDVAPSKRGRGYGHLALRAALAEAARRGITRVLLYASANNGASRAVIERAGGILDEISYSQFWNEPMCRYWLTHSTEG
jgi:predicted acetyltransferase